MAPPAPTAPAFVRMAAHPLRWRLLTALAAGDYRVRELVDLLGHPQNLISYHLRLLRGSGLVTSRRSSFDARDSYYHLDLDRCADALAAAGAELHPALRLDPAPSPV
ncbi:transcriptional regulator, partial [Nonomuraea mesophila]